VSSPGDLLAGFAHWIRSLLTLDPPGELLSVDLLAASAGFTRSMCGILSRLPLNSLDSLTGFTGFARGSPTDESTGTMSNRDDSAVDDLDMENMELSGGLIIYSMR
jgi:hypothetical protein